MICKVCRDGSYFECISAGSRTKALPKMGIFLVTIRSKEFLIRQDNVFIDLKYITV